MHLMHQQDNIRRTPTWSPGKHSYYFFTTGRASQAAASAPHPGGQSGDTLLNSADRTSQPYRGFLVRMYVFRTASTVGVAKFDWDYEVAIMDDEGALLCGPFISSSGYGTQTAAEDACMRRGRVAVDVLLANA